MLPTIGRDLHAPVSYMQAVLSLTLLLLGALVLPAGALADRFGRQLVGRIGLLIAAAASIAAAFAQDVGWLLAARAAFGVGAGLFLPAALAQVGDSGSGSRGMERWTVSVSVVTLAAPAVGALAVSVASWRVFFLVEAGIALALVVRWVGRPWVGRRSTPAGSLRLGPFLLVQVLTAAAYAGFAGLPLLLSTFLQDSVGRSPLTVGLLLAVDGAIVVLLTPVLGRTDRGDVDRKWRVAAGSALCALSTLPLFSAGRGVGGLAATAAGLTVLGVGSALFIAPLTALALDVLGAGGTGRAAGASLAVARFAAAAGIAAVGLVASPALDGASTGGTSPYRSGLLLVAGFFAVAAGFSVLLRCSGPAFDPHRESDHDDDDEQRTQSAAEDVGP